MAEIVELKKQIEVLQQMVKTVSDDSEDLIHQKDMEIANIQRRTQEQIDLAVKEKTLQLEAVQSQVDSLNKVIMGLSREAEGARLLLQAKDVELYSMHQNMQQVIQTYTEKLKERGDTLRTELEATRKKLEESERDVQTAKSQTEEVAKERDAVRAELANAKKEIGSLTKDVEVLKSTLSANFPDYHDQVKKAKELAEEIEMRKQELESFKAASAKEITEVKRTRESAEIEINVLRKEKAEVIAERMALKAERDQMNVELVDLRSRTSELAKLVPEIMQKNETLCARVIELDEKATRGEHAVEELPNLLEQIESMREGIESLTRERRELERQNGALEQGMAKLEKKLAKIDASSVPPCIKGVKKEKLRQELESLQQEHESLRRHAEGTQRARDMAESRLRGLEVVLDEKDNEIARLVAELQVRAVPEEWLTGEGISLAKLKMYSDNGGGLSVGPTVGGGGGNPKSERITQLLLRSVEKTISRKTSEMSSSPIPSSPGQPQLTAGGVSGSTEFSPLVTVGNGSTAEELQRRLTASESEKAALAVRCKNLEKEVLWVKTQLQQHAVGLESFHMGIHDTQNAVSETYAQCSIVLTVLESIRNTDLLRAAAGIMGPDQDTDMLTQNRLLISLIQKLSEIAQSITVSAKDLGSDLKIQVLSESNQRLRERMQEMEGDLLTNEKELEDMVRALSDCEAKILLLNQQVNAAKVEIGKRDSVIKELDQALAMLEMEEIKSARSMPLSGASTPTPRTPSSKLNNGTSNRDSSRLFSTPKSGR